MSTHRTVVRCICTVLIALSVLTVAQAAEPSIAELSQQAVQYLATYAEELRKENSEAALMALRQAAEAEKEMLRRAEKDIPDNTKTLNSLRSNLRNVLNLLVEHDSANGDYKSAITLRQEILTLTSATYDKKHWLVKDARRDLVNIKKLAKLSPKQRKEIQAADQLTDAIVTFYQQGEFSKAKPIAIEQLRIRKSILGLKHPDTVISLNNLAAIYQATSDYTKALPLYQQSLGISKEILGKEHPDTATTHNDLAMLYQAIGDYSKALPLLKQSLEIRKKVLGLEHPDTVTSLKNLALLHQSMGDDKQAAPLHKKSLESNRKALGQGQP